MSDMRPAAMGYRRSWSTRWAEWFPIGAAPVVLAVLAVLSGIYLLLHPVRRSAATLTMWTSASVHYDAFVKIIPAFERNHPGWSVDLERVHETAVTSRLRAAFWSNLDVADLVEVEISDAGTFFRGPVEDLGFIDLTDRLKSSGLMEGILRTRLAPYSNRGHFFGLPADVHPVMLAYRRDKLDEMGVDMSGIETWDQFIELGHRLTSAGAHYMMQLEDANPMHFEVFLFQRGGAYFDADGQLTIDRPETVRTIQWFVPLVAGPRRISTNPGWKGQNFNAGLLRGDFLFYICPDWRSKITEMETPQMAGKMALMPLPAFEPGGRRTSTWGGTMLAITKNCKSPDRAWELAQYLYFDKENLGDRFRQTNILPPYPAAWQEPAFAEPRPFWSGQPIGSLYAALAKDVPPQYGSPFIELAKNKMGEVLADCNVYYRRHGEEGFEAYVRQRLHEAAGQIRVQMTRNPF